MGCTKGQYRFRVSQIWIAANPRSLCTMSTRGAQLEQIRALSVSQNATTKEDISEGNKNISIYIVVGYCLLTQLCIVFLYLFDYARCRMWEHAPARSNGHERAEREEREEREESVEIAGTAEGAEGAARAVRAEGPRVQGFSSRTAL